MFRTDQKHMLDDAIDHPRDLLVTSKSKNAALLDTENGNAVFMTGDFSGSMRDLEDTVRTQKNKWPFPERR